MKLAYHGCCVRFELELFPEVAPLEKYEVLPRVELFKVERRLMRRLKRKMREEETLKS